LVVWRPVPAVVCRAVAAVTATVTVLVSQLVQTPRSREFTRWQWAF
jgi:hypothetical protein